MAVKRYGNSEWGITKRTVRGGLTTYKVVVYWKYRNGKWVEVTNSVVPLEVRKNIK